MTRYTFGGGTADFAIQSPLLYNDVVMAAPNRIGTAWSARTGGVQYSDLVPIDGPTACTTDNNGWINRFQGPHGVTSMWVEFSAGSRFLIITTDLDLALTNEFLSLPATSVTDGSVPTKQHDGSVAWELPSGGGGGIADGSVTTAKLADGAVTSVKIAGAAVGASNIANNAVTTAALASGVVTAAKIATDAVTTVKILDANVTAAKIATDAVTTVKILDANVTGAKLAAGAVDVSKVASTADLLSDALSLIRPPESATVKWYSTYKTWVAANDPTRDVQDIAGVIDWANDNAYTQIVLEPLTKLRVKGMTGSALYGAHGNMNGGNLSFAGWTGCRDITYIKADDNIATPIRMSPTFTHTATGGTYQLRIVDLTLNTINVTNTSTTLTFSSAHGYSVGDQIIFGQFNAGTALVEGVIYWVKTATSTTMTVSATNGGAAIASNATTTAPGSALATAGVKYFDTAVINAASDIIDTTPFVGSIGSVLAGTISAKINAALVPASIPASTYPAVVLSQIFLPQDRKTWGISVINNTVTGGTVSLDWSPSTNNWQTLISVRNNAAGTLEDRLKNLTVDCNGRGQPASPDGNGQGIRVTGSSIIQDVYIIGPRGSGNSPPKETSCLRIFQPNGGLIQDVSIDGQWISGLGCGVVGPTGTTAASPLRFVRVWSFHHGYSHGLGNFKCGYIEYIDCKPYENGLVGQVAHGFNVEDPTGPITHRSCDTWGNTDSGWRYNVDDGSTPPSGLIIAENCSVTDCLYTTRFDGTWSTPVVRNGSMSLAGTVHNTTSGALPAGREFVYTVALTTDAGALGGDVNWAAANTQFDILSTNTLAPGTWLVRFGYSANPGTAGKVDVTVVADTATVSAFGGKVSSAIRATSGQPQEGVITARVTITAAGALKFVGYSDQTAGAIKASGGTGSGYAGATGYVAERVA